MKTTRRQFIKSLIATAATAAIAPQVLVEAVHGASDLSAHERDAAADVMGLRSKQWRGHGLPASNLEVAYYPEHRPWTYSDLVAARDIRGMGEAAQETPPLFDALHYSVDWITPTPRRVQVPVLVPGDSLFSSVELDVSDQEPLTAERVQSAFVRLCAERAVERDQQILLGRPGGQMPVGVLGADEIDEIWKHSDEERPAMLYCYPILDNFGIASATVRDRIALLEATMGRDGGDAFRQAVLEQAEQNLYDNEPKII